MMRQVPGRRFNSTQTGQKPVSPHVCTSPAQDLNCNANGCLTGWVL